MYTPTFNYGEREIGRERQREVNSESQLHLLTQLKGESGSRIRNRRIKMNMAPTAVLDPNNSTP